MYKKRDSSDTSRYIFTKKGQITIFIILGILLLLAVALIIALKKEIVTFERTELLPLQRGPVEQLVTSCLEIVTKEALLIMGQQGGFIQLPQPIAADANLHLKTSPFTAVPYWAYGEIKDTPALQDLKNRLDQHIEQNLAVCDLSSQPFKETYDLLALTPVHADTRLVDKKILFNVDWEIQVKNKQGELVTELKKFNAESPVKLKSIHDLAVKIIERELRELKLEDLTQDLIALDSSQVPLFGTEFSCKEKKWRVDEVKQGIKDLLRVNLRQLKVQGTEFVEFPEELSYYENHYVWNLEDPTLDNLDLSVQFTFEENYPFTFEVTPRSGQYLKSNQLGNKNILVSALCLQTWKFVYNLDFPVLIEITDETTGYTFKLGTTVHLRNNIADRSGTGITRKTTYFDTFDDEEFCKDSNIPMIVKTYELIENKQTGVYDQRDLSGVDISYTCLKYSCDIARTEYDYRGRGYSGLIANFPYCAGGILRGKKEGYKENFARVVTAANREIELVLSPLKEIPVNNVQVVKHTLNSNNLPSAAKPLDKNEIALVTIKFRQNETLPVSHEATFIKSADLDSQLTADDKVSLLAKADFTYDLEINLLEDETIKGGYKGKWSVPWDLLQNAQEITFHVLSEQGLSETEQFQLFLGLEESSKIIPLPEIK